MTSRLVRAWPGVAAVWNGGSPRYFAPFDQDSGNMNGWPETTFMIGHGIITKPVANFNPMATAAQIGDAVTRLDGTISQAVVDIDGALERAVDQLFVRLLQLVAIAGVVVVLLVLLLHRNFASARAE